METERVPTNPEPASQVRVLTKRTNVPHPDCTGAMHHWHSGLPPDPYLWVLRWHPEQRPTRSPGQVSADGSGSVSGGGGVVVIGRVLF